VPSYYTCISTYTRFNVSEIRKELLSQSRRAFRSFSTYVTNTQGVKIRPIHPRIVTRRNCEAQEWENRIYRASYKHMMWRVPISAERRDAFRRFNAVGTETPSRFGGRCYGRTTNPARRFEEHFQYGSDVRLAERRTSMLRLMRTRSESDWTRRFVTSLMFLITRSIPICDDTDGASM